MSHFFPSSNLVSSLGDYQNPHKQVQYHLHSFTMATSAISGTEAEYLPVQNKIVSLTALGINTSALINLIKEDPSLSISLTREFYRLAHQTFNICLANNLGSIIAKNKFLVIAIKSLLDEEKITKHFNVRQATYKTDNWIYKTNAYFLGCFAVSVALATILSKHLGYVFKDIAVVYHLIEKGVFPKDSVFPNSFAIDLDQNFDELHDNAVRQFSSSNRYDRIKDSLREAVRSEAPAFVFSTNNANQNPARGQVTTPNTSGLKKLVYKNVKKLALKTHNLFSQEKDLLTEPSDSEKHALGFRALLFFMAQKENVLLFPSAVILNAHFSHFKVQAMTKEEFDENVKQYITTEHLGELHVAFDLLKKSVKKKAKEAA